MDIVFHKIYGIRQINDKYVVVTDISENGKYFSDHNNLKYKRKEYAIKIAKRFIKACHTPFIDFQGNNVKFTFEFREL